MSRRPPWVLVAPATAAAVLALLPLWYLLDAAGSRGLAAALDELWRWRTATLVARSLALTGAVTVAAALVGTFAAWVVVHSGIRFGGAVLVAFSLSLAIPSYLSAFAWVSWLPWSSGFVGAFVVLTLVCYPFVLLPVAAAMRAADPLQAQVARSLGRGPFVTFVEVTLPAVRRALAGGSLLTALYVLSDFGAVAAMRFESFTWVIYGAYRAGFNPVRAATLSLVLVAAALAVTLAETVVRGRRTPARSGVGVARSTEATGTPAMRVTAVVGSLVIIALGVGVPVGSVVSWMTRESPVATSWARVARSVASSFQIGAFASLATLVLAIPVAILAARHRGRGVALLERGTYVAHGLPGIVVAIAMVFVGVRVVRPLYQHLPLLVAAHVVLFLPLAVAAVRAAIEQSTVTTEDVARSLGTGTVMTTLRVTLPIALPGVAAAGALAMLSSVKELPTTLLLRPTGMDTLPTSIWTYASVSDYAAVGPYALALLVLAALPVAAITAAGARRTVVR